MLDHRHSEQSATYDLNNETVSAQVKTKNGYTSFELPHAFEKTGPVEVTFEPTKMKAIVGKQFVYHWEKSG